MGNLDFDFKAVANNLQGKFDEILSVARSYEQEVDKAAQEHPSIFKTNTGYRFNFQPHEHENLKNRYTLTGVADDETGGHLQIYSMQGWGYVSNTEARIQDIMSFISDFPILMDILTNRK